MPTAPGNFLSCIKKPLIGGCNDLSVVTREKLVANQIGSCGSSEL